jgi:hypothetical protein
MKRAQLTFKVDQGQNFVPTLSTAFTLPAGEVTPSIQVLGSLIDCEPQAANVFVQMMGKAHGKTPDDGYIGFGKACVTPSQQDMVMVNPDVGRRIDFSYKNGENATVTICSEADFYKNGSQCP